MDKQKVIKEQLKILEKEPNRTTKKASKARRKLRELGYSLSKTKKKNKPKSLAKRIGDKIKKKIGVKKIRPAKKGLIEENFIEDDEMEDE